VACSSSTTQPIITRLTVDALVGHMTRVREDDRFKSVGPESMVLSYPTAPGLLASGQRTQEQEGEIWFDWTFIDFWKSNHCASTPIPELVHSFMSFSAHMRISWMGSFPLSSHLRLYVDLCKQTLCRERLEQIQILWPLRQVGANSISVPFLKKSPSLMYLFLRP